MTLFFLYTEKMTNFIIKNLIFYPAGDDILMKVSGIICEYNPFHNGHLYHINKTRENGATHIVAVMSGNFVQRGDVAVMNKFERAKIAVKNGIDLVIELPVAYSLASAEIFARGAVFLLDALGCVSELSFGSECGDISSLASAAKASISCSKSPELKPLLESGLSYPNALKQLAQQKYGDQVADVFDGANNLLAIEYIKAIAYLNSKIIPFTVMRKNAMHDGKEFSDDIASASYIRQCITEDNEFSRFIPKDTMNSYLNEARKGKTANINALEKIILYKMRAVSGDELCNVPDIGQGLENRFISSKAAASLNELLFSVKTKRYPMARIRRIILCTLLGIRKQDLSQPPPYGRILAISERGCDILSELRGKTSIPFSTSLSKLSETSATAKRFTELESFSSDVYALASQEIQPAQTDYRAKIGVTE